LDYVKNRTSVTAAQKRSARKRACHCLGVRKPAPRQSTNAALAGSSGWKIHQLVDSRLLSHERAFTAHKHVIQRSVRLLRNLVTTRRRPILVVTPSTFRY